VARCLGKTPLLDLGLRLGEVSGAALGARMWCFAEARVAGRVESSD